jgi:hypothetical protein
MTLTPEIIFDAYRESNLIAATATLEDWQSSEGLRLLNRIVSGAYGFEVGDPLEDWPIGQYGIANEDKAWWCAHTWKWPAINSRLIAASDEAQNVYFPPQPSDGSRMAIIDPNGLLAAAPVTVHGNGRTVQGAETQVIDTDGAELIWFYRAELGDWVLLSTLTGAADEDFPFPSEFDDYFITTLAGRVNPRYGRALSEETVVALTRTLGKLRARYRQSTVVPGQPGVAVLTGGFGSHWGTRHRRLRGHRLGHHIRPPYAGV